MHDCDKFQVTVVSSDLETRKKIAHILELWPVNLIWCSTVKEARDLVTKEDIRLAFCADLLTDGSCHDILGAARAAKSRAKIVVTLPEGNRLDAGSYWQAVRNGAYAVLPSHCDTSDIEWTTVRALRDDDRGQGF
jgi:DNA-binding NtrC family response regulator